MLPHQPPPPRSLHRRLSCYGLGRRLGRRCLAFAATHAALTLAHAAFAHAALAAALAAAFAAAALAALGAAVGALAATALAAASALAAAALAAATLFAAALTSAAALAITAQSLTPPPCSSLLRSLAAVRAARAARACLCVDKKKSLQIGVAAQWAVVCTGAACTALPRLLHTCAQHAAPWADDFIINTKMHFASVTRGRLFAGE